MTTIEKTPALKQEVDAMTLIGIAKQAHREFIAASDAARKSLERVLASKMPVGFVIDNSKNFKQIPKHVRCIRTMRGRDHGTRIFRVDSIPRIIYDAGSPIQSKWECDAVPVSEKTGKDMSGIARRDGRETVTIRGDLFFIGIADDLGNDDYEAYCLQQIIEFLTPGNACVDSAASSVST